MISEQSTGRRYVDARDGYVSTSNWKKRENKSTYFDAVKSGQYGVKLGSRTEALKKLKEQRQN